MRWVELLVTVTIDSRNGWWHYEMKWKCLFGGDTSTAGRQGPTRRAVHVRRKTIVFFTACFHNNSRYCWHAVILFIVALCSYALRCHFLWPASLFFVWWLMVGDPTWKGGLFSVCYCGQQLVAATNFFFILVCRLFFLWNFANPVRERFIY